MTDVRLTALNPEDSKVYPVACNSSGELLTTKSDDINLDVPGELTVAGSAYFSTQVTCDAALRARNIYTVNSLDSDIASLQAYANTADYDSAKPSVEIKSSGTAYFDNDITIKDPLGGSAADTGVRLAGTGSVNCKRSGSGSSAGSALSVNYGTTRTFTVAANGSITAAGNAEFAGEKAGFTAEGNLWCTTVRGQTVILDATSNGLATWADYKPPTRRDILEEKIDQHSEPEPEPEIETE